MHTSHHLVPTRSILALILAIATPVLAPNPARADPPLDPGDVIINLPPLGTICSGDVNLSWRLSSTPTAAWRGRLELSGTQREPSTVFALAVAMPSGSATFDAHALAGVDRLAIGFDRLLPKPEDVGESLSLDLTLGCDDPKTIVRVSCSDDGCTGVANTAMRRPDARRSLESMKLERCFESVTPAFRGATPDAGAPFSESFLRCMSREVVVEASSRLAEVCDAGVCDGDLDRVSRELRRHLETPWSLTSIDDDVVTRRWWGRSWPTQVAHFEMGSPQRTLTVWCDRGPDGSFAKRKTCTLDARIGQHVIRYQRSVSANRFAWAGNILDPHIDTWKPNLAGWFLNTTNLDRR